jgi:hypothetical protein
MGYYIEVPKNLNKAAQLMDLYGAELMPMDMGFSEIPADKALICVVQNGLFDAVGYAFDETEFRAFSEPDGRTRTWLLMDKKLVHQLTKYEEPA